MPNLEELLANGYFPAELPPPFKTDNFAKVITENITTLPPTITSANKLAQYAPHDLARVGTLKRTLGVANPIHQFRIAKEIVDNWVQISTIIEGSPISISKPHIQGIGHRAFKRKIGLDELPIHRARARATSRHILKTDLSRFYHSIYTHSIPWAIHGKLVAKRDKSFNLLGNRLDKILRDGQDAQTMGIPVGPDTSFVIAEILLASVDKRLAEQISLNGYRYMDDYELCFSSRAMAEKALTTLEELLSDYELSLNPAKTFLLETPEPLSSSWSSELQRISIRDDEQHQISDIIIFFNKGFELSKEHPSSTVLKYCVSRIASIDFSEDNWKTVQDSVLQCRISEPGVIPKGLDVLIAQKQRGKDIDQQKLKEALATIVLSKSHIRLSSEIAWSIWGSIVFDLMIPQDVCLQIAKSTDPIVALLFLDARDKGLTEGDFDIVQWSTGMTTEDLYGRQWLLSYEAKIKGWLNSFNCNNHLNSDSNFNFMQNKNVSFYDGNAKDHYVYVPPDNFEFY